MSKKYNNVFFFSSLKCTYETKNKQETIRVIFFNQSNLIKKSRWAEHKECIGKKPHYRATTTRVWKQNRKTTPHAKKTDAVRRKRNKRNKKPAQL
jgi:hypothetical protein